MKIYNINNITIDFLLTTKEYIFKRNNIIINKSEINKEEWLDIVITDPTIVFEYLKYQKVF